MSLIVKKSIISISCSNKIPKYILLGVGCLLFVLNLASVIINGKSVTSKSYGSLYYLKNPDDFNKLNPDVIENVNTTQIDKRNLIFLGLSGVLLFMLSFSLFLIYTC